MEAFAVTGCNIATICKNLKEHADLFRKEIGCMIQDALDNACMTKNLMIQYKCFNTTITPQYDIVVKGWPKNLPFQKPGLFTNIDSLLKLSPEELFAWETTRAQGLADGTIVPKTCKKHCDTRVPRKKKTVDKANDVDSNGDDSDKSGDERDNVQRKVSSKTWTTPGNYCKGSTSALPGNERSDGDKCSANTSKTKKHLGLEINKLPSKKAKTQAPAKMMSSKHSGPSTPSWNKKKSNKRTKTKPMDDDNISPTNLLPNNNNYGASQAVNTATLKDRSATRNGSCVANAEPVTPVPDDVNAADNRMAGTRVSLSDPLASNNVPPSLPVPDSAINPSLLSDKLPDN
ncbi:hypothetical protein AAF712_016272 [Marasmius tenuissimus]|uniref:Uncharacterized protein n=1 Tax=Marasmius tenuissimus TaxID=585030 RepID=A0ABR2Z844_9AGAR